MKYQEFTPFWILKEHQVSQMSNEEERKYTKRIFWFFFIFTIVSIVLVEFVKYL